MKQLKLQRSIARLSQRKDQPNENIQQNETQKLIDQVNVFFIFDDFNR